MDTHAQHSIVQRLQSLGLTEKQSLIYYAVLNKKIVTVLEVFHETHIQRPTIYENARILEDLGLLVTVLKGSKRYLTATEPERIYSLIEEKREVAKDLVTDISSLQSNEPVYAPIKIYQGKKGASALLDALLQTNHKALYTFSSYDRLYELFSEKELRRFWEIRSRRGIQVHALFPATDVARLRTNSDYRENANIRHNREVRILPDTVEYQVMFSIIGDQAFFWSSPHEGFFFQFSSESYASTLRSIFETLWLVSSPLHKVGALG